MNSHHSAFVLPFSLTIGNGLGTSPALNAIGQFLSSRPLGQAELDCKINAATGNVIIRDKELLLPNGTQFIKLAYYYNSKDPTFWRLSGTHTLQQDEGSLAIISPDGHRYDIRREDSCISFLNDHQLCWYDIETKHRKIFDLKKRTTLDIDTKGIKTLYCYNIDNKLIKIETKKVDYYLAYTRQDIKIIASYNINSDKYDTAIFHTYLFDEKKRLITSKTHDDYEINYNYKNNLLFQISQTDGTIFGIESDKGKVNSIQVGNDAANRHVFTYQANLTLLKNAGGDIARLQFNENFLPINFEHIDTHNQYKWNENLKIKKITYIDGTEENFLYDDLSFLLKKHIRRDKTSIEYVYTLDKPFLSIATVISGAIKKADPFSNVYKTRFVYEPIEDGMLLRYEISPEGRVKEFTYHKNKKIQNEIHYLEDFFLLDFAEITLQDMQLWKEYLSNPDHLRIKSHQYAKSGFLKKTQTYIKPTLIDSYDEKYSVDFFGTLSNKSNKYDENKYLHTCYDYNANNKIIKTIVGDKTEIKQTININHIKNKFTIYYPNGREEETILNSAGLPKKLIKHGNNEKQEIYQQYYSNNRLIMVTEPDEQRHFELYNAENKLEYSITASGLVTKFEYNNQYHYQVKKQYNNHLDIKSIFPEINFNHSSKLFVISNIRAKIETVLEKNPRNTYAFYNVNGEIAYEVDAENYIVEHDYNTIGKKITCIAYADKLNDEELSALLQGNKLERVPDNFDRKEYYFYDKDGLQIGKQDARGYLTKFVRDAGGRIIEKNQYFTPMIHSLDYFSKIHLPYDAKDAHSYYSYNHLDQCISEIDPEGHVTTHAYALDGKKIITIRHAHDEKNNEIIEYEYDGLRRLKIERHSNGYMKTFNYDCMNQVVSEIIQNSDKLDIVDGDNYRGEMYRYNLFEEKTAIANPFVTLLLAKDQKNPEAQNAIWEQHATENIYKFGLKTKYRDVYGNTTIYYYNQDKQLVLTISPRGHAIEYKRDSFGFIIEERQYYQPVLTKNAGLIGEHFAINEEFHPILNDLLLEGGYITANIKKLLNKDDRDRVTQFEYNKRGEILKKIDAENKISSFNYNAFHECIEEKHPTGIGTLLEINHQYDNGGHVTKTIKKNQTLKMIIENKYEHFSGNLTEKKDENGIILFKLNKLGFIIEMQKPFANKLITIETLHRDFLGRVTKKIDAHNQEIYIDYHKLINTTFYPSANEELIEISNIFSEKINIIKKAISSDKVLEKTIFKHAPDGKIIVEKNALHHIKKTKLDLMGYKECEWDQNQCETKFFHNEAYQLIKTIKDAKPDGMQLTTTLLPNAFGDVEKVIDPQGIVTINQFNLCGQLLLTIKDAGKAGLNLTKKRVYDGAGNESDYFEGDIKNPYQYHKETITDGFNRAIISIIEPSKLKIIKTSILDGSGKVIGEKDELGNQTYHYYDEWQRRCFTFTELYKNQYSVVKYEYDNLNHVISTCHYILPVFSDIINESFTLDDIKQIITPSLHDRIKLFFYDSKGRERFKLQVLYQPTEKNFLGVITEKRYDYQGRIISKIKYADYIDLLNFYNNSAAHLTTDSLRVLVANHINNKFIMNWYDAASRIRLQIVDGALKEYRYDNKGQKIAEIQYAEKVKAINTDLPLEAVLSLIDTIKNKKDRITFHAYRADDKPIFTIYPNGLVERNDYDALGNLVQKCQFSKKLKVVDDYVSLMTFIFNWHPNPKHDRITKYRYDNNSQIKTITDALGNEEQYVSDALNQMTDYIDKNGNTWKKEMDRAKRLISKTSPETPLARTFDDSENIKLEKYISKIIENIERDKAGNIILLTISDGILSLQTNSDYDSQRRLLSSQVKVRLGNKIIKSYDRQFKYNPIGQKIVEKDESNEWLYHFYNSLGQLILTIKNEKVTSYFYNAIDEKLNERQFMLPFKMDMKFYLHTGIIDNEILYAIKPSADDKIIYYQNSSLYNQEKNTFGERVYESKIIAPGVQIKKHFKFNKSGKIIYEKHNLCGQKYTIKYKRDVFDNIRILDEYTKSDNKRSLYNYNLLGSMTRAAINNSDKITYFEYTPTQKIASIIYPNGVKEIKSYDVRDLLAAEGVIYNQSKNSKKVKELINYHHNLFQQIVAVTEGVTSTLLSSLSIDDYLSIQYKSEKLLSNDDYQLREVEQNKLELLTNEIWDNKEVNLTGKFIQASLHYQFEILEKNSITQKLTIKNRVFLLNEAIALFKSLTDNTRLKSLNLSNSYIPSCTYHYFLEMIEKNKTLKIIHNECQLLDLKTTAKLLFQAYEVKDFELARKFIRYGLFNINDKDQNGNTYLHIASQYNDNEIIEELTAQHKINIDIIDYEGNSALHVACLNNQPASVKLLLANNANINLRNNMGETALHKAIEGRNTDIVEILLSNKNIDINIVTHTGLTPLLKAINDKQLEIIKLLWNIKAIYISMAQLEENQFKELLQIISSESGVSELNLSNKKLSDDQLTILLKLIHKTVSITTLLISHNKNISHEGIAKLADFLKFNNHLNRLDISNNPIGCRRIFLSGFQCLVYALYENISLKYLNLDGCKLDEDDINAYIKFLRARKNKTLIEVNFDPSIDILVKSFSTEDQAWFDESKNYASFINFLQKIQEKLPVYDVIEYQLIKEKIKYPYFSINKLSHEEKRIWTVFEIINCIDNYRKEFLSNDYHTRNEYINALIKLLKDCVQLDKFNYLIDWIQEFELSLKNPNILFEKSINNLHLNNHVIQNNSELFRRSFEERLAWMYLSTASINGGYLKCAIKTPVEKIGYAFKSILSALTSADKMVEGIGGLLQVSDTILSVCMENAKKIGKLSNGLNTATDGLISGQEIINFKDSIIRLFHDLTEEDKCKNIGKILHGNYLSKIECIANAIIHYYDSQIKNLTKEEIELWSEYASFHAAGLFMCGILQDKNLTDTELAEEVILWLSYVHINDHMVRVNHAITLSQKEYIRKCFMSPMIKFYPNQEAKKSGEIITCYVMTKNNDYIVVDCQNNQYPARWATKSEIDALNMCKNNINNRNQFQCVITGKSGISFIFDRNELSNFISQGIDNCETELFSYLSTDQKIDILNAKILEKDKIIEEKKMENSMLREKIVQDNDSKENKINAILNDNKIENKNKLKSFSIFSNLTFDANVTQKKGRSPFYRSNKGNSYT